MKNKVVVITGGSSGIGEALAYKFCEENFDVVIGGTNREKIKSVISNINEKGATNLNPPPMPAPATIVPLPSILAAASMVSLVGLDAIRSIIVP